MEKVRRGEVKILSEPERTEYLFVRWARLLGMLADSERKDREVHHCPTCEAYRNGEPDMGRRQHVGCEWAS